MNSYLSEANEAEATRLYEKLKSLAEGGKDDNPEWEYVTVNTRRLVVPGGWLYRYNNTNPAMVFVPNNVIN